MSNHVSFVVQQTDPEFGIRPMLYLNIADKYVCLPIALVRVLQLIPGDVITISKESDHG